MTEEQAYRIIGVTQNTEPAEIKQAYLTKLPKLQRQLTAGNSLAVRQRAERNITRLASAWEFLEPQISSRVNSTAKAPRPAKSKSRTRTRKTQRNWSLWDFVFGFIPYPKKMVLTSFFLSVFLMLFIALACFNNFFAFGGHSPARLSIISEPWCNVEVNGKSLGHSNQAQAFELTEGNYTLKLKRNNQTLTRDIEVKSGKKTTVKAQFTEGRVSVFYE